MTRSNLGPGLIAIMGSGELTKSMLPVHRLLLDRAKQIGPVRAVFLDTPAAFQSNVEQLSQQAELFFATSLQVDLTTLEWNKSLVNPRGLALLKNAGYIFSGPGSPSYAIRQWCGSEVPGLLRNAYRSGACVAFSSAAAMTLGAVTMPVYEVYKAGEDPFWLEGMDLLSELGLNMAVVPHFDNRSGEGFDTRFCYLGAKRFNALLELLPEGTGILGVDEHSACVLDGAERTLSAYGKGGVTILSGDKNLRVESGESIDLDEIAEPGSGRVRPMESHPQTALPGEEPVESDSELKPLIEGLVEIRSSARCRGDWALADQLRDVLSRAGVELRDEGETTTWHLEQ